MTHGPNVTKLITLYVAREAIPTGGNGLVDGLEFIRNPERRKQVLESAEQKALKAVDALKNFPGSPYGDEEQIAGLLLEKIAEKRREQRNYATQKR